MGAFKRESQIQMNARIRRRLVIQKNGIRKNHAAIVQTILQIVPILPILPTTRPELSISDSCILVQRGGIIPSTKLAGTNRKNVPTREDILISINTCVIIWREKSEIYGRSKKFPAAMKNSREISSYLCVFVCFLSASSHHI